MDVKGCLASGSATLERFQNLAVAGVKRESEKRAKQNSTEF